MSGMFVSAHCGKVFNANTPYATPVGMLLVEIGLQNYSVDINI